MCEIFCVTFLMWWCHLMTTCQIRPKVANMTTRDTMIPCRHVSWKELSITKQVNERQRTNHVQVNCACPFIDSLTDWTNRKMSENYPIYETCAFMKLFIFLLRRELWQTSNSYTVFVYFILGRPRPSQPTQPTGMIFTFFKYGILDFISDHKKTAISLACRQTKLSQWLLSKTCR